MRGHLPTKPFYAFRDYMRFFPAMDLMRLLSDSLFPIAHRQFWCLGSLSFWRFDWFSRGTFQQKSADQNCIIALLILRPRSKIQGAKFCVLMHFLFTVVDRQKYSPLEIALAHSWSTERTFLTPASEAMTVRKTYELLAMFPFLPFSCSEISTLFCFGS